MFCYVLCVWIGLVCFVVFCMLYCVLVYLHLLCDVLVIGVLLFSLVLCHGSVIVLCYVLL